MDFLDNKIFKAMPWFVSDTTHEDLEWTLQSLEKSADENLQTLVQHWRDHFKKVIF